MSAELARVQRDVRRDLPEADVAGAHAFAFGRLSLAVARAAIGGDEEDAQLVEALRHVRGASVGRYALRGTFDPATMDLSRTMAHASRRGWTPAVVARDDSSATWVLTRDRRDGSVGDLLVVTLEPGEMTLVRVHGRLEGAALAFLQSGDAPGELGPLGDLLGAARATPDAGARQ